MSKVWTLEVLNLKLGILRFYQWSKDFNLINQKKMHPQSWIRLIELPQGY